MPPRRQTEPLPTIPRSPALQTTRSAASQRPNELPRGPPGRMPTWIADTPNDPVVSRAASFATDESDPEDETAVSDTETVRGPQVAYSASSSSSRTRHARAAPRGYQLTCSLPTERMCDFLCRVPRPTTSARAAQGLLDLAGEIDAAVRSQLHALGGLPAFASPVYDWDMEFWGSYGRKMPPGMLDVLAWLGRVPAADAVAALAVSLVDYQKQAAACSLVLTKSFGHQALLVALVARDPESFLLAPHASATSFLAWFHAAFPSLWSTPAEGLSLAWLLQRLVFHAPSWPAVLDDHDRLAAMFTQLQSLTTTYLGRSLLSPTAHPRVHSAAVHLLRQLVQVLVHVDLPLLAPCTLDLLVALRDPTALATARADHLRPRLDPLLASLARHVHAHADAYARGRLAPALWAAAQTEAERRARQRRRVSDTPVGEPIVVPLLARLLAECDGGTWWSTVSGQTARAPAGLAAVFGVLARDRVPADPRVRLARGKCLEQVARACETMAAAGAAAGNRDVFEAAVRLAGVYLDHHPPARRATTTRAAPTPPPARRTPVLGPLLLALLLLVPLLLAIDCTLPSTGPLRHTLCVLRKPLPRLPPRVAVREWILDSGRAVEHAARIAVVAEDDADDDGEDEVLDVVTHPRLAAPRAAVAVVRRGWAAADAGAAWVMDLVEEAAAGVDGAVRWVDGDDD
ncbi:hypothetical protein H9P43_007131 [Blastocladiella emersonii ATCC 22665]|nr:hypothetical protein H9P43_007131 [Blastocladiella emersonii ATCC 22665]